MSASFAGVTLLAFGALFGTAVVMRLDRALSRCACLGAGFVIGPPLLTLFFFLLRETGAPSWLVTLALLGLPSIALATRRGVSQTAQPLRQWVFPALAAFAALLDGLLRVLERPEAQGDGMLNFAWKGRCWFALGEPWTILQHPGTRALHPDYPLHLPASFLMGNELVGGADALPGLMFHCAVLPGMILFLGTQAARWRAWRGALLAGVLLALPTGKEEMAAGYADPALMALFAVAGVLAARASSPLLPAVAIGLLPWIKLEGLVLALVLGGVVCWERRRDLRFVFVFGGVAAVLALIWPAFLWGHDLLRPMAEHRGVDLDPPRVFRAFSRPVIDPDLGLRTLPFAALLACGVVAFRKRSGTVRTLARSVVIVAFLGPLLALWRRTAPVHLETDVALRLISQWTPLGSFVLIAVLLGGGGGSEEVDQVRVADDDPGAEDVVACADEGEVHPADAVGNERAQ